MTTPSSPVTSEVATVAGASTARFAPGGGGFRVDPLELRIAARCVDAEAEALTDQLAWFLVKGWGAPSWEAARAVAEEEIRHTADVCESLAPEVWITVKRTPSEGAGAVDEQYAVYDRLMIGAHKL